MPIRKDKKRSVFIFEFDRLVEGRRLRVVKSLPKDWSKAQADNYDRKESARLYAVATGVEKQAFTIDQAVAKYILERIPKLKSGTTVHEELARLSSLYFGRSIEDLPEVCKEYQASAKRVNGGDLSAASIRIRIRYLTAACRWGWKHHGMGESDPAARVVVPEVRNSRQEYASRAEMLRIARNCTNRMARMAIRIAFYSGMRLGEILRAEVSGTAWLLRDTKNGNPRIVPIHPRVAVCARKFKTLPKITVQTNFNRAKIRAKLPQFHFHDLRHSSASEMVNNGVDLFTVGEVLGHKDARSTKRYSHLATETLSAAVWKIGQKIPNIAQKKTA